MGSNGKLIDTKYNKKELPIIFGDFKNSEFLELKKIFDIYKFNIQKIKSFFYFPSGRWDIEMKSGILIKLPKENLIKSLNLAHKIISKDYLKNKNFIDLLVSNQLIIK